MSDVRTTEFPDPRAEKDKSGKPRQWHREVFFRGQTIFEQGAEGYRAYYIESGRVEVRMHDDRHDIRISELGAGEIFGEMALITRGLRVATVRALEDTTVTVISREILERKIKSVEDKAVSALIHLLIERLKEANSGQIRHYRNLADFQDRMAGIMEGIKTGIDEDFRESFRKDVAPLLDELESIMDRYGR